MENHSGKIIKVFRSQSSEDACRAGRELQRLRLLSKFTKDDIAARLEISQDEIGKIEASRQILLDTVQRYADALGAPIQMDQDFSPDTPLSILVTDAVGCNGKSDRPPLPIFDSEHLSPKRDVVLSIKPEYSRKILNGEKTVELRRRFPVKDPGGTLAYIYESAPTKALVGTAIIHDVVPLKIPQIWDEFSNVACIERGDFDNYFEGLDQGYVLILDKAKALPTPIPLTDLRKDFGFEPPQSFGYVEHHFEDKHHDGKAVVSN